jgi:hypothetical protein
MTIARKQFLMGGAMVLLAGCESVQDAFYKPVTTIALDRDQFIMFGNVCKIAYDYGRATVIQLHTKGLVSDAQMAEAAAIEAELKPVWVQFLAIQQGAPVAKFDTMKVLELVGKLVGMAI